MFRKHIREQHDIYNTTRGQFIENPGMLIELEEYCSDVITELLSKYKNEIANDYDEASYLHPFWKNYPPDDRGRAPRGDQYPWIEVGEHSVGIRMARAVSEYFSEVKDTGLPTGPDQRFVVSSEKIRQITKGITDSVWLMIDIKSVGPRDNFDHTVLSHNQVSGDGTWADLEGGVRNKIVKATGSRSSHDFHPTLPPIHVLSDGTVLPTVLLVVKPVYRMLTLEEGEELGQPLSKIEVITIPNGLLLLENPGYLSINPALLYPGKDDKGKNPLKVRARISFSILKEFDDWRVKTIELV